MSDRMPPNPPRPPKFPGSGKPESPNWGVWVMVLLIVGVLAFGFFTPESFGLGPRKETLESFEAQYKGGRVVLNDPKAPVEVVLNENGSEGVIHALVYKKDIQPTVEMKPFALSYSMSLPDRDKPLLNEISGYRVVEENTPPAIPEGAQKLSVPEFNRLALEGRIAGGDDAPVLAEDGSQNVLYGKLLTRVWPAATGDAAVDKQRFERVEVPFTLEFQGDRVKQLLGPDTKFKRESGSWGGILLNLLPIVLILVILFFMFRAQSGGARGAMSFGKSRARLVSPEKNKVTFKDVAGISEAKEEVWELVEFLRNPEKFRDLGATIPRGVLMVGSPGTGKTLLARAIAGESNASFYSISGSDFVEMFVGVGASRVRDMFEQAKRTSPSLIFIDEIDAVGRQRGYGMGGGNDEREQTLNALLVEMDGFESNANVIVIAATNRADILDPALLRPGRFDRQVVVNLPDVRGREQILQVHARKVKMAPNVSFKRIARGTSGFSGAQLANLINEAALLAARKGLKEVTEAELEEARDKVNWGRERRSLTINERGRRITAVHEAGHAICLLKTPHSEPLHRVTIVPRGGALGMTMWLPADDKMHQLRSEMLDQLVVAMGGRCAEQIVFGDVTSGATGDIKSATNLARRMVCEFGMSDKLGLIEYGEHHGEVYIARDLGTRSRNYSESTAELIDAEVRLLVDSAYERAMTILTENREGLDRLTEALLEFETLEGSQVADILEYGEMKNPPEKLTPPPMPSDVEEEERRDDSAESGKKDSGEDRKEEAGKPGEEAGPETAPDPFSYNPAEDHGKGPEDKN